MQPSNDDDPGDYRARAEACRAKAERAADHKEEADKWREIAAMWDGLADRFEERSPAVSATAQPDVIEGEALASPVDPEAPARPEAPKPPPAAAPARPADGKPQPSPSRFRRAAVLAACVLPILAVAALWARTDRPAAERKDVEIVAAPSDDAKRRVSAQKGAAPAEVGAPAATPVPESSAAPQPAPEPAAIAPAEPKPVEPATAASTAPAPEPPSPSAPIATAPAEPKPAGPSTAAATAAPAAVAAEPTLPTPTPESPVLGQSETARSDPAQPDVETASAADPKPEPPAREKFVGTWWPDACPSQAERRTAVPMVLGEDRARAGTASCTFLKKTPGGAGWSIVARCSDGAKTWTANIRLALAGRRLSWVSERGTQTYLRCS